jgi:hypothetical protein
MHGRLLVFAGNVEVDGKRSASRHERPTPFAYLPKFVDELTGGRSHADRYRVFDLRGRKWQISHAGRLTRTKARTEAFAPVLK